MKKNLIIIVLDTLRKDRLSLFGNARKTSPFLDQLAQGSVNFLNAYANSAWSPPSHASLLTGLLPHNHGVDGDDTDLPANLPFLFSILKSNGYQTASVVINPYLLTERGFMRDVDHSLEVARMGRKQLKRIFLMRAYNKIFQRCEALDNKIIIEYSKDILKKLRKGSDPFCLFLNLTEVHSKYAPPRSCLRRIEPDYATYLNGDAKDEISFVSDRGGLRYMAKNQVASEAIIEGTRLLYDGEVRFLDGMLKDFFSFMDSNHTLQNSVVLVISDHGENLGDHGLFYHQFALNKSLIEIPFFWVDPDLASKEIGFPVSQIDVVPSVVASLQLRCDFKFDGIDIFSSEPSRDREIIGCYRPASEVLGLVRKHGGNEERIRELDKFYSFSVLGDKHVEIVSDESEKQLFEYRGHKDERIRLKDGEEKNLYLNRFDEIYPCDLIRRYGRMGRSSEVDEATRERLRALGYL